MLLELSNFLDNLELNNLDLADKSTAVLQKIQHFLTELKAIVSDQPQATAESIFQTFENLDQGRSSDRSQDLLSQIRTEIYNNLTFDQSNSSYLLALTQEFITTILENEPSAVSFLNSSAGEISSVSRGIEDSNSAVVTFSTIDNTVSSSLSNHNIEIFVSGTVLAEWNTLEIPLGGTLRDSQGKLIFQDNSLSLSSSTAGSVIGLDKFRADTRFKGIDGTGYSVVVLDTGIDLNHSFFGPDRDGNGIADRIVYQYDFADNDNNASDFHNHGSNVSSIIGSSNATYTGIAPNVNIIALKVFSDSGAGNFNNIERALQWVVANAETYNVVSVNMSLGNRLNYEVPISAFGIGDELAALAAKKVITVSAAGNDYYAFNGIQGVAYPAADPNSLAVGAVFGSGSAGYSYGSGAVANSSGVDRITPFSQRHETMAIFAPGAPITGASKDGGLSTLHGTSQASPMIAGAIALAQQLADQNLGRRLSYHEIDRLIYDTADLVKDGDDEDDNVDNTGKNYRRINLVALGDAILKLGATVEFSQANYQVNEDGTVAGIAITLNRTGNLSAISTVQVQLSNGTATGGVDFNNTTRTVTFNANQASATLTIPIIDDTVYEGNETFNLALANPSSGTILGSQKTANVTILDNDPLSVVQFGQSNYSVSEDGTAVQITLNRTGDLSQVATVQVQLTGGNATNGADFTFATQTLTFGANQANATFLIPIINDSVFESTETFSLTLANPSNGMSLGNQRTTSVTILDNDPLSVVQFGQSNYSVSEDGTAVQITLNRTGDLSQVATVQVQLTGGNATNGADFTFATQTLTFAANQANATFLIPIINDSVFESTETFSLTLANPSNGMSLGNQRTTSVTILDDDLASFIEFAQNQYQISEDGDNVQITLNRAGDLSQAATIEVQLTGGNATNGADFTFSSQTLTFAANQGTATFLIPIINDSVFEGTETFSLTLANPSNGTSLGNQRTTSVAIVDNDPASFVQFAQNQYQISEGGGAVQIILNRTGDLSQTASIQVQVNGISAVNGADFTFSNQTLTFAANQASATFSIPIINDSIYEATETFSLTLANPGINTAIGNQNTTTVVILDNDPIPTIQFSQSSYQVNENGTRVGAAITLNRTGDLSQASTVEIQLQSGTALRGSDFDGTTRVITFAANQSSAVVSIPIIDDAIAEPTESLTLTLANASQGTAIGSQNSANLTIFDNDTFNIGEFGQINLSSQWQTISLTRSYLNPVVFLLTPSFNGADAGTTRITNTQNNSFTAFFQEYDYLDGNHTIETVSYLVLEAGNWVLDNGTRLQVGKVNTNATAGTFDSTQDWTQVNFAERFAINPAVFTQIQTYNDPTTVVTRQSDTTRSGFSVTLQEQESFHNSGHQTETVGWFAIESGSGQWNGYNYQVGVTGNAVSHDWYDLRFNSGLFNQTPQFLASLATTVGTDTANIRYQNLNNQGVQVVTHEEQSRDSEISHGREQVSFLAIAGQGLLTGRDALVGNASVGINNVDYLVGTNKKETFVLDSRYATYGNHDYAVIQNFDAKHDVIQLQGNANQYQLSTSDLTNGIAIFKTVNNVDELLGIVENVSQLNLNSQQFQFV